MIRRDFLKLGFAATVLTAVAGTARLAAAAQEHRLQPRRVSPVLARL